ncbi:hypothetical protein KUL118_53890 [Tenacibaculum sp. KUL118]|nr:hypothetical protein KUL118_53890 [Tenacibaculum sp. KUL118]
MNVPLPKQGRAHSLHQLAFSYFERFGKGVSWLGFSHGKRSNSVIVSKHSSHAALLAQKICAVGFMGCFVSKHPAGTASMLFG